MTIKKIILFLLVCTIVQSAYSSEFLPDTFHIDIERADVVYYENIDFTRENILDSIENPKAYLIADDHDRIMIAIKQENKYATFEILRQDFRNYEFERKDINGTGSEELIIYWQWSYGKSSMWGDGGMEEESSGMVLWDIDSYNCLLDFEDSYSFNSWWKTFDPKTENLPYEERDVIESGENTVYYSYSVELEKMQMTIQLIKNSEDNECTDVNGEKYFYKLTEAGFVQYKIE